LFAVSSAVETYNVALNKPAYQSSTHIKRTAGLPDFPYSARYANDGNRHTTYATAPYCAATNREANPWWAVDLEQPTAVYGVKLTTSSHTSRKTKIGFIYEIVLLARNKPCL